MMTDRIFERETTRESHSPLIVLEDEVKVEVAQIKGHALKVYQLHVYEGNGRGEEGEENLVVAGYGYGSRGTVKRGREPQYRRGRAQGGGCHRAQPKAMTTRVKITCCVHNMMSWQWGRSLTNECTVGVMVTLLLFGTPVKVSSE